MNSYVINYVEAGKSNLAKKESVKVKDYTLQRALSNFEGKNPDKNVVAIVLVIDKPKVRRAT